MNDINFNDRDYILTKGLLDEDKLLGVNHICIQDDCVIFQDISLPYGARDIEEKSGEVIDEILHELIHIIQSEKNRGKVVVVCGVDMARRMLGRKLEDRLKREVEY